MMSERYQVTVALNHYRPIKVAISYYNLLRVESFEKTGIDIGII